MSQSLLDLIATQDDEEIVEEAPAPAPAPVPEKKRSRARKLRAKPHLRQHSRKLGERRTRRCQQRKRRAIACETKPSLRTDFHD